MDGLTLARRIRALQNSGDITTECLPIISVSANARAEQIQLAIDAGMVSTEQFFEEPTRCANGAVSRMTLYRNLLGYQT